MGHGFKHGASGAPLNFKVVGGTTEPTNPKENMIWVNTDQKITSWIFSATEPENPAEGMVWISTGAFSTAEFNALKKNGIQVYPLSANQYVNGAWEKKPAKSSRDGAWAEWIVYLYKEGDEYTDVTGGWTASGFTYSGITITAGRNDDGVLKVSVAKSTSQDNVGLIGTAKKIALNGVSAIKIRYTINYIGGNGTSGTGYFGVCDVTDVANKNRAANVALNAAKDVESTAVLDVSSLDGEYYVVVSSWVGTESGPYTHYRVHEITFM